MNPIDPATSYSSFQKGQRPEEIREIKKKCQNVLEKIKGGEDFGEMALLYSEDAVE